MYSYLKKDKESTFAIEHPRNNNNNVEIIKSTLPEQTDRSLTLLKLFNFYFKRESSI